MAQLVVSAVGAAVGFMIGGPAGAQVGWVAGSMVGAYAFAQTQHQEGPRLKDLKITGTDYGETVPWVVGSPRIAGQIIWASKRREHAHTEEQGKGGGGATSTTYTYSVDLLILLSENPIGGVARVWSNNELVLGNGGVKDGLWREMRVYTGTADQLPDPLYEAAVGIGNAPAYRGRGYVVIEDLDLGAGGNIPNLTFEVGQLLVTVQADERAQVDNGGTAYWSHAASFDAASGQYEFYIGQATSVTTSNFATLNLAHVNAANYSASVGAQIQYAMAGTAYFGPSIPVTNAWSSHIVFSHSVGRPARVMLNTSTVFRSFLEIPGGVVGGITRASILNGVGIVAYGSSTLYLYELSNNGSLDPDTHAIVHSGAYDVGAGHQVLSIYGAEHQGGRYLYVLSLASGEVYISKLALGDAGTLVERVAYQQRVLVQGQVDFSRCAIVPCNAEFCLAIVATAEGNAVIRVSFSAGPRLLSSYPGVTGLGGNRPSLFVSNGQNEVIELYALSQDMTAAHRYGVRSLRLVTSGLLETEPVAEVVQGLMYRAGYDARDFDATQLQALEKPVRALALSQVASTRSALEVLQKAYFFECSAGEKIIFRPRNVEPVVRIPFVDLGFAEDSGGGDDPLTLKLGNDLEQPAQLALTYANIAGDYNADTQFSDRLVSGQASTQTMQVPLGMLPSEAKAVADALLFDMIASMHSTTLSLPQRYAYLEPGDVIEALASDGRVLRLRIVQIKAKGVHLAAECCVDDVGALESAAITDTGYITVIDPTRVPDTVWEAMDIPILRDADNAAGFYLAAAPQSINYAVDQWKGAVAARSWNDLEYQHLLHMPDACVLGSCTTVLPAWEGGAVFDEASTLDVRVWGQLASSTRQAMLLDDRVNALLVGAEVVRFRHAELLESNEDTNVRSYRLSSFLRGQRGTEWAIGAHVADERCVLLTSAMRRVVGQANEMQAPMQLKVLTSGKLLSSVQPLTFTDTGIGLKPFSVAGLRALADADGVRLRWQRRTRLACRYGGAAPVVPLGEAGESYRVQVWQGESLLRTQEVSAAQMLYSTVMRVDDGLLGGELLRFVVAQVSATVGAGYETSIEKECT